MSSLDAVSDRRIQLGSWPTPIALVSMTGVAGRLAVKDESSCAERYGGNKVRKLELLLARAEERGATDLVTMGAVGSHHVLATAIHGATLGMRTHAVLFPQPDQPHARSNAGRIAEACASWVTVPGLFAVPWGLLRLRARLRGRNVATIPVGGSDGTGALGWAIAGLELADDLRSGKIPRLDRVYVTAGSGGTVAGLALGLAIAGIDAEVVGVRVVSPFLCPRGRIRGLIEGARLEASKFGIQTKNVQISTPRLVDGWLAGGYGRTDPRIEAANAEAASLGLRVEPTYTAKSWGACVEEIRARGSADGCVWIATADRRLPDRIGPLPPDLDALLLKSDTLSR